MKLKASSLPGVCLLAVVAVAGCGGSGSSSAERAALVHKLSAQTRRFPPDLAGCVNQQAASLPISQLRALANSTSHASAGTQKLGLHLVIRCLQQGHGASVVRSAIEQRIATSFPPSLPASFRRCAQARARTLPSKQLSGLITVYATQGQAAGRSQAELMGRNLGEACIREPSVLAAFRAMFVAKFRHFAQSGPYSAGFRKCVLRKAESISSAQILQFAIHPEQASHLGYVIGRRFARSCIVYGAKP